MASTSPTSSRIMGRSALMTRRASLIPCSRRLTASVCASVNHEVVHGIPSDERALAEGELQSFADVIDRDPVARARARLLRRQRVAHRYVDHVALAQDAHFDPARVLQRFDTVIDRVFQQRLKNERWHQAFSRQTIDVPFNSQSFIANALVYNIPHPDV